MTTSISSVSIPLLNPPFNEDGKCRFVLVPGQIVKIGDLEIKNGLKRDCEILVEKKESEYQVKILRRGREGHYSGHRRDHGRHAPAQSFPVGESKKVMIERGQTLQCHPTRSHHPRLVEVDSFDQISKPDSTAPLSENKEACRSRRTLRTATQHV